MNDTLLMDLLERAKNRFHGKYRGVVTEVDASAMRLKANVPSVDIIASSFYVADTAQYDAAQAWLASQGKQLWFYDPGRPASGTPPPCPGEPRRRSPVPTHSLDRSRPRGAIAPFSSALSATGITGPRSVPAGFRPVYGWPSPAR